VERTAAWLVECGHVSGHPAGLLVAGRTELRDVPYCFGAVRVGTSVTLIDVGFSSPFHQRRLGTKYSNPAWCAPVVALARIGIAVTDVDTVVLTHKHFDHAGALPDFPAARVILQRAEYEQHRAAVAEPDRFGQAMFRATDADLLDVLDARAAAGLLTLVDGDVSLPGMALHPALDTHTPGSQYAVAATDEGPLVFAGDNVSTYENIEHPREPISSLTGPVDRWHVLADELVGAAGGATERIVPFHDDEVWRRFPSVRFADGLHAAALTSTTPLEGTT
jgi:glyoxylase-like metal-dependent hydrolase (beta-lactamase superfamily II)